MCLLCLKPASGLLRVALSGPLVHAGERGHPVSWSLAPSADKYMCPVFSVGPGRSTLSQLWSSAQRSTRFHT